MKLGKTAGLATGRGLGSPCLVKACAGKPLGQGPGPAYFQWLVAPPFPSYSVLLKSCSSDSAPAPVHALTVVLHIRGWDRKSVLWEKNLSDFVLEHVGLSDSSAEQWAG